LAIVPPQLPPCENHPALTIEGLAARRGQRLLWQGVEAHWQAGQAVWLRGANGVGKTTMLEILAGLRQPLAGNVAWSTSQGGIAEGDAAINPTTLLLGHRHPLHPHLTVVENLRYWQRLWHSQKKSFGNPSGQQSGQQQLSPPPPKLDELLASWQLQAAATQLVGTLSAGQRQRVGLCLLSLLHWRPVWLLDEPATALDQTGVGRLVQCLQDYVAAGGLCLFTSHQPLPIKATIWDLS
jgi:heme exporter protein A